MAKVIMGVGVPGSGKTTALKAFAEKYNYTYLSSDAIREELSGDARDQSVNKITWETLQSRLQSALNLNDSVVVDATFAIAQERRSFIRLAKNMGAERVIGVFAAVPFEVALERNQKRERVVPKNAMERLQTQLENEPPIIEDGFDAVFDINEFQELTRAERLGATRPWGKEFKPH